MGYKEQRLELMVGLDEDTPDLIQRLSKLLELLVAEEEEKKQKEQKK